MAYGFDNAQYRPVQRPAYCRCCDKKLVKGDMMITMHSFRCTGMNIHLCPECVKKIYEMTLEGVGNV